MGLREYDELESARPRYSLTFLGPGKCRAEIYADAADADRYPKNVSIRQETVDRSGRLKPHLASGGGYAVRLIPTVN
jgi:alpha-glucosidase